MASGSTNAMTASATAPRTRPKTSAARGVTCWVARGRLPVRVMTSSMSLSTKQFRLFADPAARVPPTRVASTSGSDGTPSAARNMVGTVVTSSSSMMRGLVRAT